MPQPQPPLAARVPSTRTHHGQSFTDHYEWLRAAQDPAVVAHLEAENTYTASVTAHQQDLRERIFQEIKARVQETDLSVPTLTGQWWYFTRTRAGQQYPIYCRVAGKQSADQLSYYNPPHIDPATPLAGEEILLDCNEFAKDLPFFELGSFDPSLDGTLLTFSVDSSGDERYTQYFMDLTTGELLQETIPDIFAGAYLTPDAQSLIYTLVDESWRPYQICQHSIGGKTADRVLYTEENPQLWLDSANSADRSQLIISSYCSEYTEVRLLAQDNLQAEPTLIIGADQKISYQVEPITLQGKQYLLILHDDQASNSELVLAPYPTTKDLASYRRSWKTLLAHQEQVRLFSFSLSKDHLVVSARKDACARLLFTPIAWLDRLLRPQAEPPHFSEPTGFKEEIYATNLAYLSIDSPLIRISYDSWVSPTRVYDYDPASARLLLRKELTILGQYRPEDYKAYRLWAPAQDGTQIPITLIHRADLDLKQAHPLVQYGYGSYETSMDPYCSIARLSLLDRSVIYAVAHVRGGGELGRQWYLQGKKLAKKNTFTDFIAVTDYLANQDWVDPTKILIQGGSAGGLLIGAVLNLAPEKYRAAIAQVPFVDALTTVLDPKLPLSALEWEEWGNPLHDPEIYRYMSSYSPYENIQAKKYPAILASTSLHDTRVLYVEPAKWIAQLRQTISPDSPTPLLKIEMDGGHGGGSGRYTSWRESAWILAWALTELGAE